MDNLLHKIGWKVHQRWDTTEVMLDILIVATVSVVAFTIWWLL